MMNREAREELYDPKRKAHKGSWLDFVKAHKNLRTAKGLLDLKAISKLWKAEKALDPSSIYRPQGAFNLQDIWNDTKAPTPYLIETLANIVRKKGRKHRNPLRQGGRIVEELINRARGKSSGRTYDPPKSWFSAMYTGIKTRSDVRNPAIIVNNIWKKLTPAKRSVISAQAKSGKTFKYDLPLPDDKQTKGTGTLRMVKPFKLAEVQVNLSAKDYLHALKSGLFSKMKRNDGTIALVARCKSEHKNCNIFVDKVK